MEFLKRNFNVILVCLLEVLVGVLLLVNPVGFTSVIIMAVGAVLLVGGVLCVIGYFRSNPMEAALRGTLAKGLAMLLAGGFLVLKPTWIIEKFPILTILYGIVILFGGLYKIQWFADALRMKTGKWLFHAIDAVVSLFCAFVILADPFASTVVLWMFIGASLIVGAVLDAVVLFFSKGNAN